MKIKGERAGVQSIVDKELRDMIFRDTLERSLKRNEPVSMSIVIYEILDKHYRGRPNNEKGIRVIK